MTSLERLLLAKSFHGEEEIAGTKLKATKDGYYDLMVAKIGFGEGE
jgi:hypothetical protein